MKRTRITDNLYILLEIRSPGRDWVSEALISRPKTSVDGQKLHSNLGQWGPSFGKTHSGCGEAGLENEKASNGVEKGGIVGMSLPNPLARCLSDIPICQRESKISSNPGG